jgi:hypothetical protein
MYPGPPPPSLPFGRHKNLPLAQVPADYLRRLLSTAKLSSGLRAACSAELAGRGVPVPPPPPPAPPRPCRGCGALAFAHTWQEDRAGGKRIRRSCRRCGRYCCFAPLVEPYTSEANASASPTPILDVLTRLEDLGVELVSDGRRAEVPWPQAQRLPDDLRETIRGCQHTLARMIRNNLGEYHP